LTAKQRVCLATWISCGVVDTARLVAVWDQHEIGVFGDRERRGYMTSTPFVVSLNRFMDPVAYRGGLGGFGGFKPPRNSEVLTNLSRIPSSVENTSVTV
jgi:hypothetical protein